MSAGLGTLILDVFRHHGIKYVFSSPGLEWAPVWEAFATLSDRPSATPKYINCRHEGLAVSAASGYSMATGEPSAVLLHAGVGPLHCAMEIRSAYRCGSPLVILTGDTTSYGWHQGKASFQWHSRLTDMGGADAGVGSYVKWNNRVTSQEMLLDSLHRGCQIARSSPQGPVFISIPWELMLEEPRVAAGGLADTFPRSSGTICGDLEDVARQLVESKNPIIITEYAGRNPRSIRRLVELSDLLGMPVFECIDPGHTNFPPEHPLHMGFDATQALQEADTVFVIASTTPWFPPAAFPKNGARVIFVDDDPLKQQLPYWGYRVDTTINGDIEHSLSGLVDAVKVQIRRKGWSAGHFKEKHDGWRKRHESLLEKQEAEAMAERDRRPISAKWFCHAVNDLLPDNAIVLNETITEAILLRRYVVRCQDHIGVNRGGLGTSIGVAAGIKLAHPDRPVIAFVGDGSFNYNPVLAGLGLFQEYCLPVMVVVLNNGCYNAMRRGHRSCFPNGAAVTGDNYFGVHIKPDPGYVRVAEAFGGYGRKVSEPADIAPAVKEALGQLESGKVALLDVVLDS